ncbi:MAG: hypothetical protein WDN49_13960 [Acetobacteraceae bacterium]
MSQVRARLLPLFLISGAAVGFETALTRYFAVAKWSEYGYWVISIVMVGFAFSGVTMALARGAAVRHARLLLAWLPVALLVAAAGGFWATTADPFNPLQLQNAATYAPQLGNIALYYLVLLPFFYLTGLYISLCFVLNDDQVGRVYGADLLGAGTGSALVLALMNLIHPFNLVPVLLAPLALATWFAPAASPAARMRPGLAGLAALVVCEAALLLGSQAAYNDFKAIYAPLHTPNARVLAEIHSPRGLYALLDDFTERVDTDVSNDAGLLNVPGPPQTYGLYRDGGRIAALPKPGALDSGYAPSALDALPYLLRPHASVLLAGSSGGFRIAEVLALGARTVEALEPDPVVAGALANGLGGVPKLAEDPRVHVSPDGALAAARRASGYDLVDLSGDFLDEAEANATAYSAEAITAYLAALDEGGIVSIPVSIREFPVYALRVLATARQALLAAGVADPAQHVVVYRSAWNVRILLSNEPWSPARIAQMRKFCDDRSFDVSYYPGMDVAAARANIYNDLPAVSFDAGSVTSGAGAEDAIADEAGAVLRGEATASEAAFRLDSATLDRPAYYDVLRLSHLDTILRRLEILPQAEIGQLVNLAVLAQAIVIAAFVLLVPLLAGGRLRGQGGIVRPVVYFAALGLGFLFIEIALIERVSFYLNDRTSAFALVLTAMLVFSGIGSLLAERMGRGGIALATGVAVAWCLAAYAGLMPAMLATLDWPWLARLGLVVLAVAPVSVALGMPFPLGLARTGSGALLPFAWAVNGAFSVVATPLANLIAAQAGLHWVLLAASLIYIVCFAAHPSLRKIPQWQPSPLT